MEITLIREGMSDYRVGQEEFRAEEGDIILIPPYCTHSAYEIPGRTMVSDSLVFHLDLLGAQGQDLSASKYLRPRQGLRGDQRDIFKSTGLLSEPAALL